MSTRQASRNRRPDGRVRRAVLRGRNALFLLAIAALPAVGDEIAVASLSERRLARHIAAPRTFRLSVPALLAARASLGRGDPQLQPAFLALLAEADELLRLKPPSVMDKPRTAVSGDKHDYFRPPER